MKIYLTEIDYARLNSSMDEGRYSLKRDGEYTEAIKLKFIGNVEMMADYLDSLGFDFRGHKEEVLMPIYEEFERRQK